MKTYYFYPEVTSTNAVAKDLLQNKKCAEGVIVADLQKAGKGRNGRQWYSNSKGGLYYSYFLQSELTDLDSQKLIAIIGKKLVVMIKQLADVEIELEWPNDLILNHKKLGGILIETASSSKRPKPKYIIIGIGLNLNQTRFPKALIPVAISLRQVTQKLYDKATVIQAITKELDDAIKRR